MKKKVIYIATVFIILVLFIFSLKNGILQIHESLWSLIGKHSIDAQTVWGVRFPRALGAIIIGAGLGIAGAIAQGIFRNPLAEPTLI